MGIGSMWAMIGICLFLAVAVWLLTAGRFSKVECLPGDINYTGKRTKVFIPITSMLILSLLLNLLLSLLGWLR